MINECGAVGGMRTERQNLRSRRKTVPVLFCPLQIPHDLTWDQIQVAKVRSCQLTTFTTAHPTPVWFQYFQFYSYDGLLFLLKSTVFLPQL
jgi:hypothetical protein